MHSYQKHRILELEGTLKEQLGQTLFFAHE